MKGAPIERLRVRSGLSSDMLPFSQDDPLSHALRREPGRWQGAARGAAARAGITADRFEPFTDGGSLVAAVTADVVVKLVQPPFAAEAERELWALARLGGRGLGVAVPELLGHGEDGGWRWLVLSRVPGTPMSAVWERLGRGDRAHLLERIGETMAAVARVGLDDERSAIADWRTFLAGQRERCAEHHRDKGMPGWFVEGIDGFLRNEWDALDRSFEPVLLIGEYTPFNLHVEQRAGRWDLVGMLDFGDAFTGSGEYDLIGPGVFLAPGDPESLGRLFAGRGVALDRALARRLHALHLMHRFSDFERQVALEGWADGVSSHGGLVERLWPCS